MKAKFKDGEKVRVIRKEPYFQHPYLRKPPKYGQIVTIYKALDNGLVLLKGYIGTWYDDAFESANYCAVNCDYTGECSASFTDEECRRNPPSQDWIRARDQNKKGNL